MFPWLLLALCQYQADEWKLTSSPASLRGSQEQPPQQARASLTTGIECYPVRCFLTCIRGNCYVLLLEKSIYCSCTHVIWHLINKLAVSVSRHDPDFPSGHQQVPLFGYRNFSPALNWIFMSKFNFIIKE